MASIQRAGHALPFDPYRELRRVASMVGLLALWAGLSYTGVFAIPTPDTVAEYFLQSVQQSGYWESMIASMRRVYGSFLLALVLAVPIGLLIGWSRIVKDLLFPALELLRPIPPIAWIPVAVLVIPGGEASIMFITFLGAFFPILLNTIEGVEGIDEEYYRASESLGANSLQTFRHVVFPASLPSIYTGMIVGMGLAWVNLIAAEMIAAGTGLGFLTWEAYTAATYPVIVVGMISIGLIGYASSEGIRWIGGRYLTWTG